MIIIYFLKQLILAKYNYVAYDKELIIIINSYLKAQRVELKRLQAFYNNYNYKILEYFILKKASYITIQV